MTFLPIITIAAALCLYMANANNAAEKRNAEIPIRTPYARKRLPYTSDMFMFVVVVAACLTTLLWLGPDGLETVRQFIAPRVVLVQP